MHDADFARSTAPFAAATELGLAFDYERSFKMAPGSLLWQRYLLAIDCTVLDEATLAALLGRIGFPERLHGAFRAALPEANLLGLGYELEHERCILKVYLEFWEKVKAEVIGRPHDLAPRPLFLGFKWDPADPATAAVTRYDCFPRLPVEDILQRAGAMLEGADLPRRALAWLVDVAARHGPSGAFKYVEASEEGSSRRSFDLNLYSAGLPMQAVRPAIDALAQHYGIDAGTLAGYYATAEAGVFGHVSAGIDRHRRSFFTVYYEPPASVIDTPR